MLTEPRNPRAASARLRMAALLSTLRRHAAPEDRGETGIAGSVEALRVSGLLEAALPTRRGGTGLGNGAPAARSSVRTLMDLASANLSAARLYEGHVNAVQLIERFASDDVAERVSDAVRNGELLGVWGADGDRPLGLTGDGTELSGSKRFASGLGVVAKAVVTLNCGPEVQLCLAETGESSREDKAVWAMSGMRASASGEYDFSGLSSTRFTLVGNPGDYVVEPGFLSGVWRIAALQLGATFGLLDAARRRLRALGRLDDAAQVARLTPVLGRALAAVGLVEQAAAKAEDAEGPDRAVAVSLLARLETEEIGQTAIAAVERAIGLQHFVEDSETGRIARDLAVYMRQAARDAFLQRAGRTMLLSDASLLEFRHE